MKLFKVKFVVDDDTQGVLLIRVADDNAAIERAMEIIPKGIFFDINEVK